MTGFQANEQQKTSRRGGPFFGHYLYMELLLFLTAGEYFPPFTDAAQRDLYICILDGDVVAVLAVSGELEEVGDPIVTIVRPETDQEVHGQLGGQDVACDGQQLSTL